MPRFLPLLRPLRTLIDFTRLYLGLGALGIICLTWTPFAALLSPLLPVAKARPLGRLVITHGFRLYLNILHWMRACSFDITALDALRGQGPLILAPNHPCLLDAVMVISRLPNVACIMKGELLRNVFLGAGSRLACYIPNDAPLDMIRRACQEMKGDSHLLIFPEGTRTLRHPINPCKNSVGLIAKRSGVPVQTLVIETDSAYLSKGWPLFKKPAMPIHYRIRLGQRFDPPKDVAAFVAELEDYFQEEFRQSGHLNPLMADQRTTAAGRFA
jgi:1-acyl-sn-glycerol-3-phosphate acyltransferase